MSAKKFSPGLQAMFDSEPQEEHPYVVLKKIMLDPSTPLAFRIESASILVKLRLPSLSAQAVDVTTDARPNVNRLTLISLLADGTATKQQQLQIRDFVRAELGESES